MFETNKGNFSGSKPIIGGRITFNPDEIGAFGLEQFFTYCTCIQETQYLNFAFTVMIGKRHIDVARKLRMIEIGSMVEFVLQPPIRGLNQLSSRADAGKGKSNEIVGGGKTMRIKNNGDAEIVDADDPCKTK